MSPGVRQLDLTNAVLRTAYGDVLEIVPRIARAKRRRASSGVVRIWS
jgi:hypothetical protein